MLTKLEFNWSIAELFTVNYKKIQFLLADVAIGLSHLDIRKSESLVDEIKELFADDGKKIIAYAYLDIHTVITEKEITVTVEDTGDSAYLEKNSTLVIAVMNQIVDDSLIPYLFYHLDESLLDEAFNRIKQISDLSPDEIYQQLCILSAIKGRDIQLIPV